MLKSPKPDHAPAGGGSPSPHAAPRRPSILLVDDDPGVRASLSHVLREEGYRVASARDGQEALELAARTPFDLALLDLNLPKQSGWDIFEQLTREHPLLPTIIITARSNQLFAALNAGAGALLEKPLEIPFLLHTITRLLNEPAEARLARLAGRNSEFGYSPGK